LKDPERRNEVFDCIRSLLNPNSKLTKKQREEVSQTIITSIEEIVDIDGEQTAAIIKAYFDSDHRTIISNLSSSPARLFTYLRGLLEPSQENVTGGELMRVRTVEEQVIMSEAQSESFLDPEIHEQYIALMCKFDPTGVYHYLQTHQDTYRMESVLPICDATEIVDAVVWILERSGRAQEALDKILDIVQEKKQEILLLIEDKKNDMNDRWTLGEKTKIETSLMKLKGVLKIGILLCENSCRRATSIKGTEGAVAVPKDRAKESETEILWFKLLDAFLDATKAVSSSVIPPIPPMMSEKLLANGQLSSFEVPKSSIPPHIANHLITTFKSYVQSIMRSLLLSTSSPYVSLPRLLLRFIQSQAKRNSTVSDFRDIFVGMIDTYKYEDALPALELLEESQILSDEASTSIKPLPALPPSPQPSSSSTTQENDLMLFRCGHGYHRRCLETESNISTENESDPKCTVCQIERRKDNSGSVDHSTGKNKGKDKAI